MDGLKSDKSTLETIVFLDVDGVLNDAQPVTKMPTGASEWLQLLDEERVALLNDIVDATGARVVLSSSWRQVHALDEMQELLEAAGFRGELLDATPEIAKARGEQIEAWLDDHGAEVERYVALDDSAFMNPIPNDNKVKTSGRRGGLTQGERDEAIRKLEAQ